MKLPNTAAFALTVALSLTAPSATLFAQTGDSGAKRDMNSAGHETKNAAVDTGHGVKQGTKKGYHSTKHFTKKVGHKVEGKQDTPANNPR